MAESYSVEAILSARDSNFTSTMENAQKSMGGLGKSTSGIGASIGKIAVGFGLFKAVAGTVKMLTSGFTSLVGEMNESSVAWQTFENNMNMLGKSGNEIDSTRKSLEQFAQQTIYSASDMASTYGQMAAIGVEDTEKLVKAMGGLAASAENPQQAMKTMSQQMTQAMTKPTLSWADFKLMLEQTPAGMAEVAKEMGYALDDFVVAVQDGEIASKDFATAVSEVGTNEHFSAMATEFKSVGQAMDGARETIANKLMPAFEMLSAIGIKAISGLTDWIDTLDFSGMLAPIASLASMFGLATDEISAMTDTIKMSSDEIQSVADSWESMTLAEKQATVQTMGQEDLSELLDMLGVDFESIPDEYTKDAFLNTHGKDALEEILWVTGKWHDLTLEEKRAVLEAQIENKPLEEAIENMGLWEDASFVSKFAEINMNDNDSGQQVLDLINYYRELDGQEPIELEVDAKTKPAEKAINKFVSAFKKFGKSVGKITKGIGKAVEKTGEYFEPAFDFLGDLTKSSLKMLGGYIDAAGQLFDGDWAGAWDTFKGATKKGFDDVAASFKTNIPVMWDKIKSGFSQGVTWLGDVGSNMKSWIFASTQSENWFEVGQWVGDKIVDAISNINWMQVGTDLMGLLGAGIIGAWGIVVATLSFLFGTITELLQPVIDKYQDWSDEHPILSSAIEGVAIAIGIIATAIAVYTAVMAGYAAVMGGLAAAIAFLTAPMTLVVIGIGLVIVAVYMLWKNWDKITGWMAEALDKVVAKWDEVTEGIQKAINKLKDFLGLESESEGPSRQGKAMFDYELVPPEYEELVKIVESHISDMNVRGGSIKLSPELEITALREAGVSEDLIQDYIDASYGDGAYEVNANVQPNVEVEEKESISQKVSNFFAGLKPVTASAQVEVTPDVSVAGGSGKSGGLTGAVGGGLSGTFSALQAEVTNQMTAISASVSTSMTTVATDMQTGMTNAQTAVQSAMVSIVSTITSGMLSMVVAGRLGTTMFNITFRAGLAQAVVTAQSIVSQIISVFSNLSSSMANAGRMAGTGFNSGLASQSGAIIGTAKNIANSVSSTIQSALRIASPSKVTTYLGEMVGAGLIAGMDGMVSGVESSANRLSLATLPTTDLGNARYSGSVSGQSTSSKLDEVIDAINRGQVIMMDSGALVGETSRQMDVALGQQGSLGGRHKL